MIDGIFLLSDLGEQPTASPKSEHAVIVCRTDTIPTFLYRLEYEISQVAPRPLVVIALSKVRVR